MAKVEKVALSIDVPDVESGIDFFTAGLGFRKLRAEPSGTAVLEAGGMEIWLLQRDDGTLAVPESDIQRTYQRHWAPIHLDVVVDDIQEALGCAIAAGAVQEGDILTSESGSIVFCSDPFGNGFCLIKE